jgi:mRNA interferase RelE/StbE
VTACFYKKSFLRDLAKLPRRHREQIERLVFEEIPRLHKVLAIPGIKKMKGYRRYYRIRVGDYRIGCQVGENNQITFYRVKSRADIYQVFPR